METANTPRLLSTFEKQRQCKRSRSIKNPTATTLVEVFFVCCTFCNVCACKTSLIQICSKKMDEWQVCNLKLISFWNFIRFLVSKRFRHCVYKDASFAANTTVLGAQSATYPSVFCKKTFKFCGSRDTSWGTCLAGGVRSDDKLPGKA